MSDMIFTAGQRRIYKEGEAPVKYERLPHDKIEKVDGIPALEIHPKFKDCGYVVTVDVTEKINGVNSKMIDWWWGNMEKGYLLWAPGEHYGFEWIKPPCEVGYEGSIEASYEFDPVHPIVIERQGMHKYPFTDCFKHCWMSSGKLGPIDTTFIHMYEDDGDGILWRTVQFVTQEAFEMMKSSEGNAMMADVHSHIGYEAGRMRYFLPGLYDLWKDHPDPWQNVKFDLRTQKMEDGTWGHVSKNLPPQK